MKKGNSLYYLVSTLISGLSGFLLISLLTKNFSTSDYGVYSLIITTVGLSTTVQIGWITQSIMRFYQESKENPDEYKNLFNTIMFSTISMILLSAILGIILILVNNFNDNESLIKYIGLTFLLFVPESFYLVFNSILRAKNDAKIFCFSTSLYAFLKLGLPYFYIKGFSGELLVDYIIVAFSIAGTIVSLLIYSVNIRKDSYIRIKSISTIYLKKYLKYGFPLIGLAAIQWILSSSDRYIIRIFRSSSELGIYSLAYSLATNIFNIITTYLLLVAYPKIIKEYNRIGMSGASHEISNHLRKYFLLIIPSFWGIAALSNNLIEFFSSKAYLEGSSTFVITSLSVVIYGFSFYYNKAWELTKKTNVIFHHALIAGVVNILLNVVLVPKYGYLAAAITTLMSYVLFFVITFMRSRKITEISFNVKSFLKILLSSYVMYLILCFFINRMDKSLFTLIILVVLGALIYLIMLIILREVQEELYIFRNQIKKILKK